MERIHWPKTGAWIFMLILVETGACLLTKGRWVNKKAKAESTPWTEVSRLFCPWGFSRQEYWSGLPCPPPGDLLNPGIKPTYPALQADSLLSEPPGKPWEYKRGVKIRRGEHNMQNQAEGWAWTRYFLLRKGWRLIGSMGEKQGGMEASEGLTCSSSPQAGIAVLSPLHLFVVLSRMDLVETILPYLREKNMQSDNLGAGV